MTLLDKIIHAQKLIMLQIVERMFVMDKLRNCQQKWKSCKEKCPAVEMIIEDFSEGEEEIPFSKEVIH